MPDPSIEWDDERSHEYVQDIIARHEACPEEQEFEWAGLTLVAFHHVFNPTLAESSIPFADYVRELDLSGKTVLDAGCGTGILSVAAGLAGADRIIAYDCNPRAVENTKENLWRAGFSGRSQVEVGDHPPRESTRIDVALCNEPFFALRPITDWHLAFCDPNRILVKDLAALGRTQGSRLSIYLLSGAGQKCSRLPEIDDFFGGVRIRRDSLGADSDLLEGVCRIETLRDP